MNETQAQEELSRLGRRLFDCGHMHPITDNIKVRLGDGFLTKPTHACLGFVDPTRLARLDAQGLQSGGLRGLARLRNRDAEFCESIAKDIDRAVALDCPCIHVMVGRVSCKCRLERSSEPGCNSDGLGWLRAWRQRV
jgi:hypothetical protein